ncbi:MAG: glycosyltransferase family 2 protein [Candidatus Omnitrophota bacterium]
MQAPGRPARGAHVITHARNAGKGACIREGFRYFLENTECEAAVIMDGDGQHSVDDIGVFCGRLEQGSCDMLVGNRMSETRNMPFMRLCTNAFMSFLLSLICGQKVPDTQCGFRLVTRKVIQSLSLDSSNYETESEMLVDASRKGFRITSVPIETVYSGEKSNIHPVKDTIRFFVLVSRLLLKPGRRHIK